VKPSFVPSVAPFKTPSSVPSTSKPSQRPSQRPTLLSQSPSKAPTSRPSSSPSSLPTTSPVTIYPGDQAAWESFRAAFPSDTYCSQPGNACHACTESESTSSRRILCKVVSSADKGRRLLGQTEPSSYLHITGIYLESSDLVGYVNVSAIQEMEYLRTLDLSNSAGSVDANTILGPTPCIDIPGCGSLIDCIFPPTAPQVCTGGLESGSVVSLGMITGIIVAVVLIFLCLLCIIIIRRRSREQEEQPVPSGRRFSIANAGATLFSNAIFLRESGDRVPVMRDTKSPRRFSLGSGRKTNTRQYKPDPSSTLVSKDDAWQESFDYQSNSRYWVNMVTGEFSWINPTIKDVEAPMLPIPTATRSPHGWEAVYDSATDSSYYYNAITGEFSRTNPDDRSSSAKYVDPLWKQERDVENGTDYWVDLESGRIIYTKPADGEGTIVDPALAAQVKKAAAEAARGNIFQRAYATFMARKKPIEEEEVEAEESTGTPTNVRLTQANSRIAKNRETTYKETEAASPSKLTKSRSIGLGMVPFSSSPAGLASMSDNPMFNHKDMVWEKPQGVDYFVNKRTGKISRFDPTVPEGLKSSVSVQESAMAAQGTSSTDNPLFQSESGIQLQSAQGTMSPQQQRQTIARSTGIVRSTMARTLTGRPSPTATGGSPVPVHRGTTMPTKTIVPSRFADSNGSQHRASSSAGFSALPSDAMGDLNAVNPLFAAGDDGDDDDQEEEVAQMKD